MITHVSYIMYITYISAPLLMHHLFLNTEIPSCLNLLNCFCLFPCKILPTSFFLFVASHQILLAFFFFFSTRLEVVVCLYIRLLIINGEGGRGGKVLDMMMISDERCCGSCWGCRGEKKERISSSKASSKDQGGGSDFQLNYRIWRHL